MASVLNRPLLSIRRPSPWTYLVRKAPCPSIPTSAPKPTWPVMFGPNITGTILGAANEGNYFTGAFSRTGDGPSKTYRAEAGIERYNSAADFYASRSSGVYSKATTVQPSAMVALVLIKS